MNSKLWTPLLLALTFQATAPGPRRARLPSPDYLPKEIRPLLERRMARHGDDMLQLTIAVTLLQRDVAAAIAHDLAEEPRLARPSGGAEDDLNALLPEKFFRYQDALRSKAKAVERAARQSSDSVLAASFGRMMETCVQCHATYLRGAEDDAPAEPPSQP